MCSAAYTICLLIWVTKLERSHELQSNKNKTYRGRISVSLFLTRICHSRICRIFQHNFPHGLVSFADGFSTDPLRHKADCLKQLVQVRCDIWEQCDQIGRFLDFGQLFKAFCKNQFVQISHILRQFL